MPLFLPSSYNFYFYTRNFHSLKQGSFLKGRSSLESVVVVQSRGCKLNVCRGLVVNKKADCVYALQFVFGILGLLCVSLVFPILVEIWV